MSSVYRFFLFLFPFCSCCCSHLDCRTPQLWNKSQRDPPPSILSSREAPTQQHRTNRAYCCKESSQAACQSRGARALLLLPSINANAIVLLLIISSLPVQCSSRSRPSSRASQHRSFIPSFLPSHFIPFHPPRPPPRPPSSLD